MPRNLAVVLLDAGDEIDSTDPVVVRGAAVHEAGHLRDLPLQLLGEGVARRDDARLLDQRCDLWARKALPGKSEEESELSARGHQTPRMLALRLLEACRAAGDPAGARARRNAGPA